MQYFNALLNLPGRILRHRRFLWDLVIVGLPSTPAARARALDNMAALVQSRHLYAATDRGLGAAKGFAKEALTKYPELRRHLEHTPHLGVLETLSPHPMTRAAYVGTQLDMMLRAKRSGRVGLGAPGGVDTNIKHEGEEVSGLAIVQTWALLTSWGHLFGTFATERALLYHLARSDEAREQFIAEIHPALRVQARGIIERQSFYKFVHALVAYRLSRASMPPPVRATMIEILALYLSEAGGVRAARLKRLFQTARQLSYLSVHQGLGLPRIDVGTDVADLFSDVIHADGFEYQPFAHPQAPVSGLLKAVDAFQFETFFTGDAANRLVLQHLKEFHAWWRAAEEERVPVPERVDALWSRPTNWPTPMPVGDLKLAARLHLPLTENQWIQEAMAWHGDGAPWRESSFLITLPPGSRVATCSILSLSTLFPVTAHHIAERLAAHCEASWVRGDREEKAKLWHSVAAFGRLLLSYIVNKELEVVVRPVRAAGDSVGFAAIAHAPQAVAARIDVFVTSTDDEVRSRELEPVARYVETITGGGPVLVFLGRVLFVDRKTNQERHEADGVVAQVLPDGIEWHFLETKARGSGPRAQLERLRGALTAPCVLTKCETTRAGLLRTSWRK